MARAWLVTSRGIARKIKNSSSSCLSSHQFIKEDAGVEANMKCPNCNHLIDDGDVTLDWPGFPAGVKFEPSDVELMEHLSARIGLDDSNPPHILIDEFIPMLEDVAGICYTHPQNLPGAKKDGSSVHFFHRVSNAYAKGPRKRRRISQCGSSEEQARWHKTGKTKRVVFHDNGVQKGWKKIMVLYANAKGAARPGKAKWVMHQYHIGPEEDELEGQLVVSKVFYQHQSAATRSEIECGEETEMLGVKVDPRTPNTSSPQPPRLTEDSPKEDDGNSLEFLLNQCHEYSRNNNDISTAADAISTAQEFSDLDNILIDTPLNFQLADLQFGSQESTMSWLDKLLD